MIKTCSISRSHIPWMAALCLWTAMAQAQVNIPVISRVDIYKGDRFTQTASGVAATASNPYAFQINISPIAQGIVTTASINPPTGGNYSLANLSNGDMAYTGYAATATAFDNAYGIGNYTLAYHYSVGGFYSGDGNIVVALGAGAYPTAPQLSNFTPAQTLDVTRDFNFSWAAFAGGTGSDFIQFQILDGSVVVYDTGFGMNATLDWSSTSENVVGDTLFTGKTYTGRLVFYKVVSDNSGAEPMSSVGYSSETTFTIKTTGSGTVDTTPPTLTDNTPANNATGVSITSFTPITFEFSEPMAQTESIQWSANVNPSGFTYYWAPDGKSLLCYYPDGLPGSSTITWTLNPTANNASNFRDLAGNLLAVNTYTGKFTTVQGATNNPCNDTNTLSQTAGVTAIKIYNYLQTSVATPAFDPEEGAFFSVSIRGPSTLTEASVVAPSTPAVTYPLEVFSVFGNTTAYYNDQLTNLTTFDTKYPAGNYQITAISAGTPYNTTASLPDTGKPTVPHVANYTAAQTVDPNADFTLQWDAYPSPTSFDTISLTLSDSTNMVFHAPDKCIPINLDATATSIVIPKGTFQEGITYTGSLQFFHLTSTNIALLPGGPPGMSGISRTTKFKLITTGGATLPAPVITNAKVINSKTQMQFQVTCTPGHSLVIRSTPDFKTYTPAYTTNVTVSPVTITIPLGADTRLFYQAVQ